jgi:hypothetical protein
MWSATSYPLIALVLLTNFAMIRFLSIASSYPYVMHALLSFSANHLAWTQSSPETRNLQIHHGSIALRGLHEAIGSFSSANADAILAASLLMLWQATDWYVVMRLYTPTKLTYCQAELVIIESRCTISE